MIALPSSGISKKRSSSPAPFFSFDLLLRRRQGSRRALGSLGTLGALVWPSYLSTSVPGSP